MRKTLTSASNPRESAFTLVEIMMGILIITLAFYALGTTFAAIGRSILVNKNKTIATNLAQEKIESLKDLSYYRLLVTTATATDSNFPGMVYDQGTTQSYYPEETLVVGDRTFKRRVLVEFVKDVGGDFYGESWTANDTGIKRITVYVVWQEGNEWKKVELKNLRNNPDRATLDYTFAGTVSSGTTGHPIYNAYVDTVENPSYFARTDASGKYSFKVSPGTYTLRASATGYFTATSTPYTVNTGDTGSSAQNFALTLKALGRATGYAYIRDHLVITQVVASTDSNDNNGWEWVELYNPTTYNILIASRSTPGGAFNVFFVTVTYICRRNHDIPDPGTGHGTHFRARPLIGLDNDSTNPLVVNFRSSSPYWSVNSPTISIPSQSFFLIANASTITAVSGIALNRIADAYYTEPDGDFYNAIRAGHAGGIRVTGNQGTSFNGRIDWHDGVAWDGPGFAAPTSATEGTSINTGGTGFNTTFLAHRLHYKADESDNPFAATVTRRNTAPFAANCFDRNNNGPMLTPGGDWYIRTLSDFVTTSSGVANVNVSMPCYSGTPAVGAAVSANDGMSAVAYVQSYGSFTLTNIATGTWNVTIASGNYIRDISSLTLTATILSTSILNGSTDPKWGFPTISWGPIALTTSSIYGYISGVVRNVGSPVSDALVTAYGASANTDSLGKYRLKVDPAFNPFSVQASKPGLSTEVIGNIGVSVGVNISTVDFNLTGAGSVKGFVTTNGTPGGKLPGIPVVAVNSASTTLGSALTDINGYFTIPSVATGIAIVSLQLESGEESNRNWVGNVVVVSTGLWIGTFTVTNAYGKITGTVGTGSSTAPITTGVLLVATTQQISSDLPPELNSSLRSGTSIHYAVSSDAVGRYSLPLRGNASYYLYGWYPTTLGVSSSSAPKRFGGRIYVGPGQTVIDKNLNW